MKKKNILSLVLALALVAALAVGGTLAYFTDNDTETNTFTMGHVDINLDESNEVDKDDNPIWTDDGLKYDNVVPGDEQPKKARVTVKDGSADCFLMVSVEIKGTDDPAKLTDADLKAILDGISGTIDRKMWEVTAPSDTTLQCVYLGTESDHIAHAGEQPILFEKVSIPASFDNHTADSHFEIILNAFAIQSRNLTYNETIWGGTFGSLEGKQEFQVYEPTAKQDNTPIKTETPDTPAAEG